MASSCSSSRSVRVVLLASTPDQIHHEDEDAVFDKRILRPEDIETAPRYSLALKDWTKELEGSSERNLDRKLANWSRSRYDLYQILGIFFVSQGVIITVVAQSNLLHRNNWYLVFALSFIVSLAAIGASVQKLTEIAEYKERKVEEKNVSSSLRTAINNLKVKGLEFDPRKDQLELRRGYTKKDFFCEGSSTHKYASLKSFCRVWVISYAGSVLLLLCAFSVITMIAVPP